MLGHATFSHHTQTGAREGDPTRPSFASNRNYSIVKCSITSPA